VKNRESQSKPDTLQRNVSSAHRVQLPGFVVEEEIGLGDLVKRTTYALGIKSCAGCERRAATLNRWMTFTGQRQK
jgi:hypothetical protein